MALPVAMATSPVEVRLKHAVRTVVDPEAKALYGLDGIDHLTRTALRQLPDQDDEIVRDGHLAQPAHEGDGIGLDGRFELDLVRGAALDLVETAQILV